MAVEVWIRPDASVDRHALDAVHAGLELEPRVGSVAADLGDDLLEPAGPALRGREHLHLPSPPFRVAGVHPVQVGGEQRRLVAAGAGAHLDDHVAVVVRIARHELDARASGRAPPRATRAARSPRAPSSASPHRGRPPSSACGRAPRAPRAIREGSSRSARGGRAPVPGSRARPGPTPPRASTSGGSRPRSGPPARRAGRSCALRRRPPRDRRQGRTRGWRC